jgi:hypothetical protein
MSPSPHSTKDLGGPPKQKGFFMFKGDRVQEIGRHDFASIAGASSHRIKEHMPIPSSMISSHEEEQNKGQE